ncbi:hypothetical protein ACQ4LE_003318 [Meloidogyne hapla]
MKFITLFYIQLCVIVLVSSSGPPSSTPKPCDEYGDCPDGYVCQYDSCVPVSTNIIKCCYPGNGYEDCYYCPKLFIYYEGKYCKLHPRPTTTTTPTRPPTTATTPARPSTTTKKPAPQKECCYGGNIYGNCYHCEYPLRCTHTFVCRPPPCDEYGECPYRYKCVGDLCVSTLRKKLK